MRKAWIFIKSMWRELFLSADISGTTAWLHNIRSNKYSGFIIKRISNKTNISYVSDCAFYVHEHNSNFVTKCFVLNLIHLLNEEICSFLKLYFRERWPNITKNACFLAIVSFVAHTLVPLPLKFYANAFQFIQKHFAKSTFFIW